MAKTTKKINNWTCPKCGSSINLAIKDMHRCLNSFSTERYQKDVDNGIRRLLKK